MTIPVLIPAYNPKATLLTLVRDLKLQGFDRIVVVNDGSTPACGSIFAELRGLDYCHVLDHAVNLGKGAALKTGFNYSYLAFPDALGVITADADGQHLAEDVCKVANSLRARPEALIMGARALDKNVPLRSALGNKLTRYLFRALIGQKLRDTQSGLRGIPRDFIPKLLQTPSNGYEFELDMLLACKYSNRAVVEEEIQTVYIEDNKSSHFNPLFDSLKIYFVLLRFTSASLLTSAIDYSIFLLTYGISANIAVSQASARSVALIFNYIAVKRAVFYSEQKHAQTLPKYLLLVLLSGLTSYLMINVIIDVTSLGVVSAKVLSESIIFLANFAIQRDFIFTRSKKEEKTDWDLYYSRPYKTATFSRRITEKYLHNVIHKYARSGGNDIVVGELGGANSCFFDGIRRGMRPLRYHVVDNNQLGLTKFRERIGVDDSVVMHNVDVLDLRSDLDLDLVFSVGLIEHFSFRDVKKVIEAHLRLLKPGGIAIISFPTPTFLYRMTRFLAEMSGLWIFHDEKPLTRDEVAEAVKNAGGTIQYSKIIWPIFLTQMIIVVSPGRETYSVEQYQTNDYTSRYLNEP